MYKIGKILVIALALTILCGCNFDKMYSKIIPPNVQKMDQQHIDAVMAKDPALFLNLQGNMSEDDFNDALNTVFEAVVPGEIIRQTVVSTNTRSTFTTAGKSKSIVTVFEIQKADGFNLITLSYSLDKDEKCCALNFLNVSQHEISPHQANLDTMSKVLKIAGIIIFLLTSLILILLFRKESKARAIRQNRPS